MNLLSPMVAATLLLSAFVGNSVATAQVSVRIPESNSSIVRQVSAAGGREGLLAARRQASSGTQIRVTVQYLMVDGETLKQIYESLPPESIHSSVEAAELTTAPSLKEVSSHLDSSQQTRVPAWVTSCVLNDAEVAEIIRMADESELSELSRAPGVSLLDGQEADMSDMVQRPFVIGFEPVEDTIKPTIRVLDEGTRLRMLALPIESGPSAGAIALTAEISVSRILQINSDQIYGLQKEPLTVHVPIHQTIKATASQQLLAGRTLLIDPHVTKTKSVMAQSNDSVLAKIPYVGRRFKNSGVAEVEQKMLVLLKPAIEKRKGR